MLGKIRTITASVLALVLMTNASAIPLAQAIIETAESVSADIEKDNQQTIDSETMQIVNDETFDEDYLRGDVDLDGKVTQTDATIILRESLIESVGSNSILDELISEEGKKKHPENFIEMSHRNGDVDYSDNGSKFSQTDATFILRVLLESSINGKNCISDSTWNRNIEYIEEENDMANVNALVRVMDENNNINNIYPATKAENVEGLQTALDAKVDKVTGKGLSANDYTTAEKNKLGEIEAQANKTIISTSIPATPTDDTVPSMKLVNDTYASNSDLVSAVSTLNTAISGKADNSTVTALTSRVSQAETDIDTQTARIDAIAALPSGSTSGDAELIDIRTKADGTTATNAGSAVREQVNALRSDIDYNILELLPESERDYRNTSSGEIILNWSNYKTCHITGTTTTQTIVQNVFANENKLPNNMEAGGRYKLFVDGAEHCCVEVFYITAGASWVQIGTQIKSDIFFTIPTSATGLIVRIGIHDGQIETGLTVDETITFTLVKYPKELLPLYENGVLFYESGANYTDADDVNKSCVFFCSSNGGVADVDHIPDGWQNVSGWLETFAANNNVINQIYYPYNNFKNAYRRVKHSGVWQDWEVISPKSVEIITAGSFDADDMDTSGIVFCSSTAGVPDVDHLPTGETNGWLENIQTYSTNGLTNLVSQVFYSYINTNKIYRRIKSVSNEWSAWVEISGGTQIIEQEISRDTYNNTFNITSTPQITTDNHRWLQSVDTETADETGKTDMTSAIMTMLNSTGYCKLSEGIFYVSGNIDMPEGSMLEGCGKKTIIRLLNSVNSGYICRMKKQSTIKNIRFSGAYNNIDISGTNISGRKGIYAVGNRDGEHPEITPSRAEANQISNCWFDNLDSAIYAYNTGGGVNEGFICSDCYINNCMAGINLDYWTEYNKFTNVMIYNCHYACINNGGNNVFTNCTFHGVEGFIIDGSKPNAAHGSCIGCTFNHIGTTLPGNGTAIKIINTVAGFVFSGCQLWYGKIHVENSNGIIFANTLIGGAPNIETTGSGTVFFNGCLFNATITRSIASPVKFDNCYMYDGTPVTE